MILDDRLHASMQPISGFSISHQDRAMRTIRRPVYGSLRDAIVTMTFVPGRRLSENELGELFKVSRTPIREAIAELREDRLVEIVPQYGTFVAPISPQAIHDAQFVRGALECEAVRLVAGRATDADIAELTSIIRAQQAAARAGQEDDFHSLDRDFHRALFALSARDLWSFIERADGHLERVRRASGQPQQYMRATISRHKKVCDALRVHDATAADAALREDVDSVSALLSDLRSRHPDYFGPE